MGLRPKLESYGKNRIFGPKTEIWAENASFGPRLAVFGHSHVRGATTLNFGPISTKLGGIDPNFGR